MRLIDADAFDERVRAAGGMSEEELTEDFKDGVQAVLYMLSKQPTIQPEPHEIGYNDCANALLKMWMDNVLTDGEYYRIANKLNEKWGRTELPEPYKEVNT